MSTSTDGSILPCSTIVPSSARRYCRRYAVSVHAPGLIKLGAQYLRTSELDC